MFPALRAAILVVTLVGTTAACTFALLAARRAPKAPAVASTETKRPGTTSELTRFGIEPTTPRDTQLDGELPRRVLALYDSHETVVEEEEPGQLFVRAVDAETSLLHRLAELPLNHLGLAVDFVDVAGAELPSPAQMAVYRGVVTWFADDKMKEPERYLRWLAEQAKAGRRVVILEHLGAFTNLDGVPVADELVRGGFAAAGGAHLGNPTQDGSVIAVAHQQPKVVGFEKKLPARLDYYEQYRANPGAAVHLKLERTDLPHNASDAVWTGPRGGFVLAGLVISSDKLGPRDVTRWILDPFAFFEAALGVEGWPRPDFTTLNGQRIFYSQVDGDGLDTITELDHKSRCGAVIRDQIFKHYDLPFSASIVVGLTAPPPVGRGTETDVGVARSILALDNVEIGSHGLAHPMDWRAGQPGRPYKADPSVSDLPGYPRSDDVVGRGVSEVEQSVRYIDEVLAPPGKRCVLMLWTGWCNPSVEQLELTYRLGLRNMNGGDGRFDDHYPSYAHLAPAIRQVGPYVQFHSSAANDFILTENWNPPYYRFRNVVQTFERTESPRRVMPVNVYFHYYSARNLAGLTGLKTALDWAVERPLAPMFTTEFIDIVRDFHWLRMARVDDRTYTVAKGGALRTLRFDGAPVHVDLTRSAGVLGYFFDAGRQATYVHLDGSTRVRLVLSDKAPSGGRPWLLSASHVVDHLVSSQTALSFRTHGPTARQFTFAGFPPGARYEVTAFHEGEPLPSEGATTKEVEVDGAGHLTLRLADRTPGAVDVSVRRRLE